MNYFLDKGVIYDVLSPNIAFENKVKGEKGLGKSKLEATVFW